MLILYCLLLIIFVFSSRLLLLFFQNKVLSEFKDKHVFMEEQLDKTISFIISFVRENNEKVRTKACRFRSY